MRDELIRLLQPEVAGLGYELVELEFHANRGGGLLRIYIDRTGAVRAPPGGEGEAGDPAAGRALDGVTVDDCEAVSRRVSAVLDVADPIPAGYTLEVSSPGLDRPLRTREHFARFQGSRVRLETTLPRNGRRRWTGRLAATGPAEIALEVDGERVEFGLAEIRTARLVPEFGARRE
jgi:ribosome maturation factor RimP